MTEPGRPSPGTALCRLEELADPGARGFDFHEGDALWSGFLVRTGGVVRGYVDRCPHVGSPLEDLMGRFLTGRGDYIMCAAHGALFKPEDGLCVGGPCVGRRLKPWPVAVEDGVVKTL